MSKCRFKKYVTLLTTEKHNNAGLSTERLMRAKTVYNDAT